MNSSNLTTNTDNLRYLEVLAQATAGEKTLRAMPKNGGIDIEVHPDDLAFYQTQLTKDQQSKVIGRAVLLWCRIILKAPQQKPHDSNQTHRLLTSRR